MTERRSSVGFGIHQFEYSKRWCVTYVEVTEDWEVLSMFTLDRTHSTKEAAYEAVKTYQSWVDEGFNPSTGEWETFWNDLKD